MSGWIIHLVKQINKWVDKKMSGWIYSFTKIN